MSSVASFTYVPSSKSPSTTVVSIDEAKLVQEAVDVVYAEAAQRQFWIEIHENDVRYSERGLIILPVTTSEGLPIREEAKILIALEDAWNEQEPAPVRRVHLAHAWNPELSIRSTPPPLNLTA